MKKGLKVVDAASEYQGPKKERSLFKKGEESILLRRRVAEMGEGDEKIERVKNQDFFHETKKKNRVQQRVRGREDCKTGIETEGDENQ